MTADAQLQPTKAFKLEFGSPITAAYNQMRLDQSLADVVILVGETRTPVFAHSIVLSHRSDYYKNALSNRWINDSNDLHSSCALHPNTDFETINIVLEFIYTGSVTIPDSCLSRFAVFADFLTLESVSQSCLDYWAASLLSPSNAMEFYVLTDKLNHVEYQSRAILCGKNDMGFLKKAWMKWTLLFTWSKLKQLESEILHEEKVFGDLKPLLHLVGLYRMEKSQFVSIVEPDLTVFPTLSTRNSSTKWIAPFDSAILRDLPLKSVFRRVSQHLERIYARHTLLFSTVNYSDVNVMNAKYHASCDKARNTLLLVKTVHGAIMGGFVDVTWNNFGPQTVEEACLFHVKCTESGSVVDIEFFHLFFGNSLFINKMNIFFQWGANYETNGRTLEDFAGDGCE
ncbi:hypothetical protein BCR33DRAFT_714199, partial [Rhizoclosmatium globosum]